MKIIVDVQLSSHGFTVYLNNEKHPVSYPPQVWQAFPEKLRQPYAEYIAFMTSVHFSFRKSTFIKYLFPLPLAEPLFYYGLMMAAPENLLDFDNTLKTTDYLRIIFNSFYNTSFTGHTRPLERITTASLSHKQVAIVPFTFGKDSLLTYAVCKELGIQPIPIFFVEPHKIYENQHRERLAPEFKKEFGTEVYLFSVPLPQLKQRRGLWWGWDIFLTQYTFFLIPFIYYHKARYFFWSNEQDRNIFRPDNEGFIFNPTFDQSARWMQVLNTGLRFFGCETNLGSLLEPLTELGVHYVLHHRYPNVGKYQTSCEGEATNSQIKRWCGQCLACSEDYIYLLATGVAPERVAFKDNLLSRHKKYLFYIFKDKKHQSRNGWDTFRYFWEEQLYAFYLAYRRGVRGGLMDDFAQKYLLKTKKKSHFYQKTYLSLSSNITIPQELSGKLTSIYKSELSQILRELN